MQRTEPKDSREVIGSRANRQDGHQMGVRQVQRLHVPCWNLFTTNDECAITQLPRVRLPGLCFQQGDYVVVDAPAASKRA
ncbi:unnamed protein product [Strongylus vulgaris]|uniref:Uncharacterized protein n=1 Tax=Strongylus vulgaris TaxID=40348 RepID=A0A3P7IXD9_STRVU|nr:unnamed protein product [Strongylus vulgaris]